MKKQKSVQVMADFTKMKRIAQQYFDQDKTDLALRTVFLASGFMYHMNQVQYDPELEALMQKIANQKLPVYHYQKQISNVVIYYDGFGQLDRGLTRIYLTALLHLGYQVKYITFDSHRQISNRVSAVVGPENVFWITGKHYMEQMLCLAKWVAESGASAAFLCLHPDDVVAAGGFAHCPPGMKRYLINLTDHAFWLGKSICDTVLNFREFGCRVCLTKRDFTSSQTAYLPYYPADINTEFQGLPFDNKEKTLIFSGGALYKTQSRDNRYYKLVESLLNTCKDTVFLYLGNGDGRKMRKLEKKYSGRFFFLRERPDFFELMKQCTLYLSTYPYNGGLMTQYALLAGKIPITLSHPGIEQELCIRREETFWNYRSEEECLKEIQTLLRNEAYRKEQEAKLSRFLVSELQFEEELQYILSHGQSKRKLSEGDISFQGFQELPLENLTGFRYFRLFFRKKGFYMAKHFPVKYLLGMMNAFYEKIINREV